MSEYRQALRCVPGEYRFDDLAYARRANSVPRQVSRHRGAPGDGQGRAQAALH